LFRAPGRVNLIGEHTDYNEGFVLPMAIDRDTVVAAAPAAGRKVRVRSLNRQETAEFDLDAPSSGRRGAWIDYVEGVGRMLERRGARLLGADLVLESDVPEGAGLSSSASLEVSTGLAMLSIAGCRLPPDELALSGQAAEHEYVGTQCGIMDQLVAVRARAGHALLIDCRSLEARPIPLDLGPVRIVVLDSGVKHELAASEYNRRRAECAQALEVLRGTSPGLRSLRDLGSADVAAATAALPDTLARRCRHVVTENERTLRAAEALAAGDLAAFGALMAASHRSLRDDYEVSCLELDALVDAAAAQPGVLGARMTGGGFGGCTVNLVETSALDGALEAIRRAFARRFRREPRAFVTRAAAGAEEIAPSEGFPGG
jgi:galactokinase